LSTALELSQLKTLSLLMLVTPRDAVIADSGIRSLRLIKDIDFELAIYPNSLTKNQQLFYFPRWREWPFVRILEPAYGYQSVDEETIRKNGLEGPYEPCYQIWDSELPKLDGHYIGTVDADFEILNYRFIPYILKQMDQDNKIIGFSTDSSETALVFDSYSQERIRLNERNHTWFCIYRKEAFTVSKVSHKYFERQDPELAASHNIHRDAWDEGAWFQNDLKLKGYVFKSLPDSFRGDYIHYGEFSHNMMITRANVFFYRIARKLAKRYRFGLGRLIYFAIDRHRGRYYLTPKIRW
jgi:hypothetical protein